MNFHLDIYLHFVRVVLILAFIGIIVSCEKEDPLDSITPIPGWAVENLNEDYFVQFPANYTGFGFNNSCFEKLNPAKDIIINQCYCYDPRVFFCVGDSLAAPLPDEITKLPHAFSSSFFTLNNKEPLYASDSTISAIIYYSDGFLLENEEIHVMEARYYMKIDTNYISLLKLQFNSEKIDTVKMICNSIVKR